MDKDKQPIHNRQIDEVADELRGTISHAFQADQQILGLTTHSRNAIQRWFINTSVVSVLSQSTKTEKSEVVEFLAGRTHGLNQDAELRVAIREGLRLAGPGFRHELLVELNKRLKAHGS
jgi:hypothetical protein